MRRLAPHVAVSKLLVLWLALVADAVTVPVLIALLLVYGVMLGCSLRVQSTTHGST